MDNFIIQAYKFYPIIKFMAEISENEIAFLDTAVFNGERLKNESILASVVQNRLSYPVDSDLSSRSIALSTFEQLGPGR